MMIHVQFVGSRSPVVFLAFCVPNIWKVSPAKHPLLLQEACRIVEVSTASCVKSAKQSHFMPCSFVLLDSFRI